MISNNAVNLYFNPGCALSLYRPESEEKILKYLRKNFSQIQLHKICCRHEPKLPSDSVIINVCAGCDRRFRSLYKGVSTISLWEILSDLDDFPFPDYGGMEVSIHDPCPVRDRPAVHKAVRDVLQKMNVKIIETENSGTKSICCGDSLYPGCDAEKIHNAMKKRMGTMPCDVVVVYCVSCIKAAHIGGKTPRHLIDLLLAEETDPQECDIKKWHMKLYTYIETH